LRRLEIKRKRRIVMDCVFCKIIEGNLPSQKFYEDDECIVIKDINPAANKHYLLIPKQHYKFLADMSDGQAQVLGRCFKKLKELIPILGLENGYRLVVNQGEDALQTVPHLHIHILAGQKMGWTPA